jgi:uridylate kinase
MDASAISLSRENKIPIVVFSIQDAGSLPAVLEGRGRATIIRD